MEFQWNVPALALPTYEFNDPVDTPRIHKSYISVLNSLRLLTPYVFRSPGVSVELGPGVRDTASDYAKKLGCDAKACFFCMISLMSAV